MSYSVQTDWAPAYELVVSLHAYLSTQHHRLQEMGDDWAASVGGLLSKPLQKALAELPEPPCLRQFGLLIWQCPERDRSAAGFLRWLSASSAGEIYELLAPSLAPEGIRLPPERSRYAEVLAAWNEEYFAGVAPAVHAALADRAANPVGTHLPLQEAVEEATNGFWVEPEEVRRVLLVPQYHKRPLTVWSPCTDLLMFLCPVDLPVAAGEPGPGLLRLTRALADESRLRILYSLAQAPLSFTEIVGRSGLTKGTVHRHVTVLRAAGLVRSHLHRGEIQHYSLRPGAFSRVEAALTRFVSAG